MKILLLPMLSRIFAASVLLIAQDGPERAVIYRFAVAGKPDITPGLSNEACPKDPSAPDTVIDVDDKLLTNISAKIQKGLSKKMPTVIADGQQPQPRSLLITGCITKADAGHAAGRMVGMGLGASHLEAHVRLLMQMPKGAVETRVFDVAVTGTNKLPPLGPAGAAVHAAKARRQTLSADGSKLGGEILKRLKEEMGSPNN